MVARAESIGAVVRVTPHGLHVALGVAPPTSLVRGRALIRHVRRYDRVDLLLKRAPRTAGQHRVVEEAEIEVQDWREKVDVLESQLRYPSLELAEVRDLRLLFAPAL